MRLLFFVATSFAAGYFVYHSMPPEFVWFYGIMAIVAFALMAVMEYDIHDAG